MLDSPEAVWIKIFHSSTYAWPQPFWGTDTDTDTDTQTQTDTATLQICANDSTAVDKFARHLGSAQALKAKVKTLLKAHVLEQSTGVTNWRLILTASSEVVHGELQAHASVQIVFAVIISVILHYYGDTVTGRWVRVARVSWVRVVRVSLGIYAAQPLPVHYSHRISLPPHTHTHAHAHTHTHTHTHTAGIKGYYPKRFIHVLLRACQIV